jgi:hypothetical protein
LQPHSGKTHGIGSAKTVCHFHLTILFFNAMPDFQPLSEHITVFKFKPLAVFSLGCVMLEHFPFDFPMWHCTYSGHFRHFRLLKK